MRPELALIADMRTALRAALDERAFLRRDRGDGLFISNAPVFTPETGGIGGFDVERIGQLIRIRPDTIWVNRAEAEIDAPEDDFARSMLRFRGREPDSESMALFCRGIKLLDAGEGALPGEIETYDRDVRRLAARALRGENTGGGLYALSLLDAMMKT